MPASSPGRAAILIARVLVLGSCLDGPSPGQSAARHPLAAFDLPASWQDEYWADPRTEALRSMEPGALADLVPRQSGLHYARCPSCDASEADDPFEWSVLEPDVITCRSCRATFPNDEIPAKVEDEVPAESIEVLPGTTHHYPYHLVPDNSARYPGERIYLDAKRDDLIKTELAKFALYAALARRDDPGADGVEDATLRAALILIRFAEVYPAYAVHDDRPGAPKFFQEADLRPPYREDFRSAKWDRNGALNVPLNLAIAYAILRDDPALVAAGELLEVEDPRRAIEEGLLRPSARFLLGHPDPHDERSIYAARGLLAVGSLLGDDRLQEAGLRTLDGLAHRGFYHDGHWRSPDPEAHRRVVNLLDGWFRGLIPAIATEPGGVDATLATIDGPQGPGTDAVAILSLARRAAEVPLVDPVPDEVQRVSWPPVPPRTADRRPTLLGGVGLARLAAGKGEEAIDLELHGFGDDETPRFDRLAIRLSFGGLPVLGDLDDLPPSRSGWERSTAAHNAAIVDGLNQRETPAEARLPAPASDPLVFAVDDGLQVASMSDAHAYPRSTTRYRRTVAIVHDERARYAIVVTEIRGGHRHDQLFHAPAGSMAAWRPLPPTSPKAEPMLPPGIVFMPDARAADGRWFLQAFGAFEDIREATVDGPTRADLVGPSAPLLRLHILDPGLRRLITADVPDPTADRRGALIVRAQSPDPAPLATTSAVLFEPPGWSRLRRVGRVESPPETVLLAIETDSGPEHLLVNLSPGTFREVPLTDGTAIRTDGLLVLARDDALILAGGTYADRGPLRVAQRRVEGSILAVRRRTSAAAPGGFETDALMVADPDSLRGRTLIIAHGDSIRRGWTIDHVEATPDGRLAIAVVEEPGFTLDPETGDALYYQFPNADAPGPHRFIIPQITRTPTVMRND